LKHLVKPYPAHKPNPVIETERTYLRYFQEDDIEDIWELDSDPQVHLYLGNNPLTSKEGALKSIRGILQQYIDNGIGRLVIIEKSTGEFLGWSGLKWETQLSQLGPYYDLGYRLKQKHWKKGFASETAKAVMKYGFEELKLPKICAAADVDNIGSNKILKALEMDFKNTFTYEGTLCNWYELPSPSIN